MKLSAVIISKNEEKNINGCIKSLDFCDEIIVIDDNSIDKTIEIAKGHAARVFRRSLDNNFAAQRNFALKKAKGEWVLFVDADERIPPLLRDEIIQLINNPTNRYVGFYLRRRDFMLGKKLKYGEAGDIKLLRLAKRKAGRWRRRVHEYWDVKGATSVLKNSLIHIPHPTVSEFLHSVNWMSSLHAQANFKEGKQSSLFKIIAWPMIKFIHGWIFKIGVLDGVQGFLIALIMSFHSYLAWSKLWFIQKRTG